MSIDKINKAIREMSKTDDEVYSIVCNVISVDSTAKTCDCKPVNSTADILGVRLMAQSSNGFLITPNTNSIVVVTMINKFTGYVAMFSEIREIQLNGKNYDGLVKINDVVTKLNNLENKVNAILTWSATHTHAGVTAGFGVTGVASTAGSPLTTTVKSDLENITVKQGNG